MATRKPPRIVKWRENWTLFYFDHATGAQRRVRCSTLGAETGEQRRKLLQEYVSRDIADQAEVQRRGGRLAYDTPIVDALDEFLADVDAREAVRLANPSAREGLAPASATELRDAVIRLKNWLIETDRATGTTGNLDCRLLNQYFAFLATEKTNRGKQKITRSGATINKHRGGLRACFRWLNRIRPPVFPDFETLAPAFKLRTVESDRTGAFSPSYLQRFLAAALEREAPARVVEVARVKNGKAEIFKQTAEATAATPVSRLFLLLALTGARLGEALALKWQHVDLDRGRITIYAQKTGRKRIVPLIGAPEGEIAPRFVELLRRWKLESGDREFVLPHGNLGAPLFPKSPWQLVNTAADLDRIGPQMLRRNFVSYAASLGIPAAVAALWSGHSAAIAEKWYRQQVLDRANADTIEAAMGLEKMIEGLLRVVAADEILKIHGA